MTLHKEFFGLLFLIFVGWILVASTPTGRIENFCRPVGWTGNFTTSMSSLVVPSQQARVQGWFAKVEYGCRYITWRFFYQEEYNAWKATQSVPATDAPGVDGDADKSKAGEAQGKSTSDEPTKAAAPPAHVVAPPKADAPVSAASKEAQ